jgi:lysophospholipase L1-like esterase
MKRLGQLLHAFAYVVLAGVLVFLFVTTAGNYPALHARMTADRFEMAGYPQGNLLLVGSSTMEYWSNSTSDLGPYRSTNAGIGGSTVGDWVEWADTLIVPFHPDWLLVYAGSNDMPGGENSKPGADVAAEIEAFLTDLHADLPDTRIIYVAIIPSPSRAEVWPEVQICNNLVSQLADRTAWLDFADANPAILSSAGAIQDAMYRTDRLHMNADGYRLWGGELRQQVFDILEAGGYSA